MRTDVAVRAISLFAGVGGLDLGVRLAIPEARTVCFVERELYAAAVLAARMEEESLDPAPIYSDVCTFSARGWRGKVDLVHGGIPCFGEGTMVLTKRGYEPIESVAVGDFVLTHKRRWRRVTKTMSRNDASLIKVKAQGVPGVITTKEHPFYARVRGKKWNNDRRTYERDFGEPEWVEAGSLGRDHFLSQTMPDGTATGYRPEFWWLVGRYLADGWRVKRHKTGSGNPATGLGKVVICCAHKETEELRSRIESAGFNATEVTERTATKFHIHGKSFYGFLEPFGRGARGKKIPGFALELDKERARALLDGYLSGDGYRGFNRDPKYKQWAATSVSKALALGVALLAQRAFGVIASVRKSRVKPTTVIEGRVVNQRTRWIVTIPDSNRSAFVDDGIGWKLVRSVEPAGSGRVFNLEVDSDNSYIADGAIVHNCQPYSLAGEQKGNEDERALWPEFARIVAECRPSLVFIENVPAFVIRGGFRPLGEELCRLGYELEDPVFLAAGDVGAPHIRERVFILAHSERAERWPIVRSQLDWEVAGRPEAPSGASHASGALADTEGLNLREHQPQRGSEERVAAGRPGGTVADPGQPRFRITRRQRRHDWGFWPALGHDAHGSIKEVANAGLKRPERRPGVGRDDGEQRQTAERDRRSVVGNGGARTVGRKPVPDAERDAIRQRAKRGGDRAQEAVAWHAKPVKLGVYPPGPKDLKRWERVIDEAPWLAPSIKPGVRVLADELALVVDENRSHQLRCTGNGVVPSQAGWALMTLLEWAGITKTTEKEGGAA
jgi:site-specific DNA-cytosine methylase/intein/homing endonuclease